MLDCVCTEIKNFFEREVFYGTFTIQDGVLSPSAFLKEGQYFRIVGSMFNDGVHQNPANNLVDESFDGEIWSMAVPPVFIELVENIKKYEESDAAKPTAYVSESFGGYSYTRPTGDEGKVANSWQEVFGKQLRRWRKI